MRGVRLSPRAVGAVLALCLTTAPTARSAVDQSETHGIVYPHVRAVIQTYYPSSENPSVLQWAERIVLWNNLEILALQGILDISTLVATCTGPDASDPPGLAACQDETASLALRSQVLALEEACPVSLSAGGRSSCLFAFYQQLSSMEQVLLPSLQHFLFGQSNLWRAYAKHGRPDVMRFRAIPEIRELAELDTVLLFVLYVRAKALEEQTVLLQRIESGLAGQAWANEVPRGGLFLTAARLQLDWTRLQLEWLWTYRSYSLASAGWAEPFHEWLELTRHGRISSSPLRLPQLQRRAAFPRPPTIPGVSMPADALRRPPSVPPYRSAPGTVSRGLYLVLAKDSVIAEGRNAAPTLWVRGGQPIVLRRQETRQTDVDRSEPNTDSPGPDTAGDDPLPPPPPPELQERPLDDRTAFVLDFLDDSYWASRLDDAMDRWPSEPARFKKSADKWAFRLRALGGALDAAEVADAIVRQDIAGAHIATVEMLGGPIGILAMEMTGFDEKLRKMDAAGYSVPAIMNYSVEVAADILSPFSFGRPAPFSHMVVGDGPSEPSLEAQIKDYEQRLRDAAEDARRRRPASWPGRARG